tara:strand:+ start:14273 stop:15241 length:969 start_codon:yes stop_codon:yes gene_type:complete
MSKDQVKEHAPLYLFLKQNLYIDKLTDIKILQREKSSRRSVIYKAGNRVFKNESEYFLNNCYPAIKNLYSIDKKFIPNYKLALKSGKPYLFYYKYIEGKELDDYVSCFFYNNKKNNIINSINNFIKFYIKIDANDIFCGKPELAVVSAEDPKLSNLYPGGIDYMYKKLKNSHYRKLLNINNSFYYNLKKIYNTSITKQKKTKKTLVMFKDLNSQNIIVDNKNNIKLIDVSDGLNIGNFNLCIHRYFSLLWMFGEKVMDKAIKDCNIDNDIFVKELSFFYFYLYSIDIFKSSIIKRLIFNYRCSKICKKMVKSLENRYPSSNV